MTSAPLSVLEEGVVSGRLPVLASLLERGRSFRLHDVMSDLTESQWTAMLTGTNVEDHGAVADRVLAEGTYTLKTLFPEDLPYPPFWRYLSDSGLNSTVLGSERAALVPGLRGVQVFGWGVVDPFTGAYGVKAEPSRALQLLDRNVPGRRRTFIEPTPISEEEQVAFVERSVAEIGQQAEGLRVLMRETDWDFFFGCIGEPHDAGHLMLHRHDPDHPEFDPGSVGDGLITVCAAADAALGDVLEEAPAGCDVFFLVPAGMEPIARAPEAGEAVLERAGWLARAEGVMRHRRMDVARGLMHAVVPLGVRRRLGRRMPAVRSQLLSAVSYADVDWSRTRAFVLPPSRATLIRLNVRGRDPQGIIEPGRDYDGAIEELRAIFGELTDLDSGEGLVRRFVRTDELTGRPVSGALPDLFVDWRPSAPRRIGSARVGEVEVPRRDPRTGIHGADGLMVGVGEGIVPSQKASVGEERRPIVDVAPTILRRMKVDVPAALRGRAIDAFAGETA